MSDVDSAIHSGEEEPRNIPFWACPLCKEPLEDLTSALKQHVEDDHTLTNPRTPSSPPVEPIPSRLKGYQCDVAGRMSDECLPTCLPGRHYAGYTMMLEELMRLEELKGYKWEPLAKEDRPLE